MYSISFANLMTHRVLIIRRVGLSEFKLPVKETDSVDNVKLKLQAKLNIPARELRLVYAGRAIDGGLALKDYKLFLNPKSPPVVHLTRCRPPPVARAGFIHIHVLSCDIHVIR